MPNEVGCGDESSYMRRCVGSSRSRIASNDASRKARREGDRRSALLPPTTNDPVDVLDVPS